MLAGGYKPTYVFQSTLPTRGSDFSFTRWSSLLRCFNPRSPRGGATTEAAKAATGRQFQSTLPTRGSDAAALGVLLVLARFQSTLPTRGSDLRAGVVVRLLVKVSIHAPHEGERRVFHRPARAARPVSIHAPHEGERRRKSAFVCSISANLLNIIHCGTVTRAVSRRRIALFRLFSVRRSGVFMYAYASH